MKGRGKARKARGRQDTTRYVYRPRRLSASEHRKLVVGSLRDIAGSMARGKLSRSILRKAHAMELCGRHTAVRECGCGHQRPGSGITTTANNAKPCQCRTCPFCARRHAQKQRKHLAQIIERLAKVHGHRWRHIVLTSKYDPTKPDDLTIRALKARVEGLRRAWNAAWNGGLKQPGAGAYVTFELAGGGFVHVHVLHYGRFVRKKWFETTCRTTYDKCGFAWIEDIGDDEARQKIVIEVAKYVAKSPSPYSEEWLGGTPRDVMAPELVAAWEIATTGVHLSTPYGSFKDVKTDERGEESVTGVDEQQERKKVEAEDVNLACPCCGVVGEWSWRLVPTEQWVRQCHEQGLKALHGSRWRPKVDAGFSCTDSPPVVGGEQTASPPVAA